MNNKLNLTDNEKRDIIKYLESGKPLPEKYRFLLFDTDKEVELLWNGKTDEVENMVLPFQAIEQFSKFVEDYFELIKGFVKEISPSMEILNINGQPTYVSGKHSGEPISKVKFNKITI